MEHKLINELRTLIESCGQDEAKLMNDLSILVKQRESKNDAPMVEAPRPLSEVHQAYMDECSTKENTSKIVYTGYTYLDAQFPLLKGEVVVVGARPGMGKTAFLVNLAWGIAAKMPLLYCNYSINARSLANRFIVFFAGIERNKYAANQKYFFHSTYFISYLICRRRITGNCKNSNLDVNICFTFFK